MLIAAALVTGLMGHWVDTFVIIAVVVLNVAIGFVQEGKAEKALQAIRHLLAPHAVVLRDGRQQDIDAADLVPGDVVLLASGDSLPADVRLLQARSLRIDEAALTGESVPVDKQVDAVADDAAIGDRICMGYAGTLVTRAGAGRGGCHRRRHRDRPYRPHARTVEQGTTPLLRKMQDFGRILTLFILATGGLLFLFGTLVRGMGPVRCSWPR